MNHLAFCRYENTILGTQNRFLYSGMKKASFKSDSSLIYNDLGLCDEIHATRFHAHGSLRYEYKVVEEGLDPMKKCLILELAL